VWTGSSFACRITTVKHAVKNAAIRKSTSPNVREALQAVPEAPACQPTMASAPASMSESPKSRVADSFSRRADRLFDILRLLRAASGPVTAATLAEELEVTVRTIYRDIVTLQARRIPIEGAAGIGYVLGAGSICRR
jgi:biotin operon repressor